MHVLLRGCYDLVGIYSTSSYAYSRVAERFAACMWMRAGSDSAPHPSSPLPLEVPGELGVRQVQIMVKLPGVVLVDLIYGPH